MLLSLMSLSSFHVFIMLVSSIFIRANIHVIRVNIMLLFFVLVIIMLVLVVNVHVMFILLLLMCMLLFLFVLLYKCLCVGVIFTFNCLLTYLFIESSENSKNRGPKQISIVVANCILGTN